MKIAKYLACGAIVATSLCGWASAYADPADSGQIGDVNNLCEYKWEDGAFSIWADDTNVGCQLTSDNKEIWRYFATTNGKGITSFTIGEGVRAPEDMTAYFSNLNEGGKLGYVTSMNVKNLDVSGTMNMEDLFADIGSESSGIEYLDLSGWDTSSVTNMFGMFRLSNIKEINLAGFNTAKVKDFTWMFASAKATELTLGFDMSSATAAKGMFGDAHYLTKIDLSGMTWREEIDSRELFKGVGRNYEKGTEIVLNSSFATTTMPEFDNYSLPYNYYSITGTIYSQEEVNNLLRSATGAVSLLPATYELCYDLGSPEASLRNPNDALCTYVQFYAPLDASNFLYWGETRVNAPESKVLAGVTVNGEWFDENSTAPYIVTGKTTVKLVWREKYIVYLGNGQEHLIGSGEDVVMRATGYYDYFGELRVDGKMVLNSPENYEIVEIDMPMDENGNPMVGPYFIDMRSLIVTLKADFIDTLGAGPHKVEIVYVDNGGDFSGTATGEFTNVDPSLGAPEAGAETKSGAFSSKISALASACAGMMLSLFVVPVIVKRKK